MTVLAYIRFFLSVRPPFLALPSLVLLFYYILIVFSF